jgi:hypothetical protein
LEAAKLGCNFGPKHRGKVFDFLAMTFDYKSTRLTRINKHTESFVKRSDTHRSATTHSSDPTIPVFGIT